MFACCKRAQRRFRHGSHIAVFEGSDPFSRCHSQGLPEKFDEGARLPVADLSRDRFYRTPRSQQLDSFHQTYLPSPNFEAHPNFFAENSLERSDAYTDFSADNTQGRSIRQVRDEDFSDSKRSRLLGKPHGHRNWRGVP